MYHFTREDLKKVVDHPIFLYGVQLLLDETFNLDGRSSEMWFRGDPKLIEDLKSVPRTQYGKYLHNYSLPYLSICEDPNRYRKKYQETYGKVVDYRVLEEFIRDPDHEERRRRDPQYARESEEASLISTVQRKEQDIKLRNDAMRMAFDRYEPSWWAYHHHCNLAGRFLMYPFIKVLYPFLNAFVYRGINHTVGISAPKNYSKQDVINYFKRYPYRKFEETLTRDMTKPVVFDIIGFSIDEPINWIFYDPDALEEENFSEGRFIEEKNIIDKFIKGYGHEDNAHVYYRLSDMIDIYVKLEHLRLMNSYLSILPQDLLDTIVDNTQ